MTPLQISFPEAANRFLEEQVAQGRYRSTSDCVIDLVEKARIEAARAKLTQLVREGMESGEGEEINAEYWNRLDLKMKAELETRRSA